jgi:hypothetical protein
MGLLGLPILLFILFTQPVLPGFNLTVVGPNNQPITGYRWLLEEDTTKPAVPGTPAVPGQSLSVSFHSSYMPVVANGDNSTPPTGLALDPNKRYFLSVLPDSGFTIGGVPVAGSQTSVTVVCNSLPLPTAQISVFVFEDNNPINNQPDLPQEVGLANFTLQLWEAGGTYGASGGRVSTDAFGNPLGTTYVPGSYNPDGSPVVDHLGTGVLKTDANGECLIKNLVQGKYSIVVTPPAGQDWHETSTIEGTNVVDAWVKPNEPPFFQEFGPPGWHVFTGFVHSINDTSVLTGGCTITGRIVNLHPSRPPDYTFHMGDPVPGAWVGLNTTAGTVAGQGVYAQPCQEAEPNTGVFSIPNVPAGTYSLSAWDDNLLMVFAQLDITVTPADVSAGVRDLGDVPIFNWFHRMDGYVFVDDGGGDPAKAQNGFWDPGELPLSDQTLNIRFRDGSVYQTGATDNLGNFFFTDVFPFFNWLVAEADFLRYKATGGTFIIDNGGPVLPDNGWTYPSRDLLTPQPQFEPDGITPRINPNTGNNLSVTETMASTVYPFLLQGFQGFAGTTNVMEWGKVPYGPDETGGVTGVIYYDTTRAEDDPRYCTAEPWQPGIPRVQVNLYQDTDANGNIDDINGVAGIQLADVDNYPFNNFPGPEDIDRNTNGVFDYGDALQVTWTDCWDDNLPTGAQGDVFYMHGLPTDCYDGLRNFNQVRPAVFDGGYSFQGHDPITGEPAPTLLAGTYIVEAVPPPGYQIVKEEDKNVDFGDDYTPAPQIPPPVLVGDLHQVPPYLTLFPDQQIPCKFAGQFRPLPDRKQVVVSHNGTNAAADFFMFTEVPVAGHIVGIIVDDTANEFNPAAPAFGEKYSPPWLPISIKDYTGRELYRTYSDEFGAYNLLVPSTYTINPPFPSGVSPNMITVVLNDPGPIPDPMHPGQYITDPWFNRKYSQFSYTFQYMPGKTTYLDTPVVPIGAFAGPDQYSLDCEFPGGTPKVFSVSGPTGGPYVQSTGQVLSIVSEGDVDVPNPLYNPNDPMPAPPTVARDYGFGTVPGTVTINGVPLQGVIWTAGSVSGTVAPGTTTGELRITRGDNGMSTLVGVTVTVGDVNGRLPIYVNAGGSIQDAIDLAQPNDLILVAPGRYDQLPIMWKPLRLQGWGAGSTIINAVKTPAEKLVAWRNKVQALVGSGAVDLLPGQAVGGVTANEPGLLNTEEGPGIMVLAKNASPASGGFGASPNARIDGFTITGADHGGGLFVNGYARFLEISNNHVVNNAGFYGGGIRIGHPADTLPGVDAQNDFITIHHNHIAENGGQGGAGGGVSINTGTTAYEITENFICGNFNLGYGGGIGHMGLSDGGIISYNTIAFNQTFDQGSYPTGGGIFVGGSQPAGGGLTDGSGSVAILGNLVQGNMAGAGDGGGIRLEGVNGTDVLFSPGNPANWYAVDVFNNMVVNNVTGLAGGGIALQDAVKTRIIHNTIADNDSTATGGLAFTAGNPNDSNPQPAGLVARANSPALAALLGAGSFSNPELKNNIIRHNRSFYFHVNTGVTPATYQLLPDVGAGDPPVFADLAVMGAPGALNPLNCVLTDATGHDPSNTSADPLFVSEYTNGASNQILVPEVTTAISIAVAFDEGGNFIDVHFGPLALFNPATGFLFGDYHILGSSPARSLGDGSVVTAYPLLVFDYDGDSRPNVSPDAGADQYALHPDLNLDGVVNALDLAILIQYLNGNVTQGSTPFLASLLSADINGDGLVNALDLLAMSALLSGSAY